MRAEGTPSAPAVASVIALGSTRSAALASSNQRPNCTTGSGSTSASTRPARPSSLWMRRSLPPPASARAAPAAGGRLSSPQKLLGGDGAEHVHLGGAAAREDGGEDAGQAGADHEDEELVGRQGEFGDADAARGSHHCSAEEYPDD